MPYPPDESLLSPLLIGLFVLLLKPTAAGSKLRGTGLPGGITLENSAEGAFPFDVCALRFTRKMIRQTINPKPITPPTTPPAMAPVSLLLLLLPLGFDTGEVDELDDD
jgi:hypothetical protein